MNNSLIYAQKLSYVITEDLLASDNFLSQKIKSILIKY